MIGQIKITAKATKRNGLLGLHNCPVHVDGRMHVLETTAMVKSTQPLA
jgi:hypothetical protein